MFVRKPLSVVALASWLFMACDATEQGSAVCEGLDFSGYLDGRWTAPPLPAAETVIGPEPGSSIERLWFGPDVPQRAATLWWSADLSELPMNYAAAPSMRDSSLRDARLVVLIDGVQISLHDSAGQSRRFLPVHIAPGAYGSIDLTIPSDQVSSGAHTMLVAVINASTGAVDHGLMETIIKDDDARFGPRADHTQLAELKAPLETTFVDSGDQPIYLDRALTTVTSEGTLPLRMMFQAADGSACRERPMPIVVTTLVDFEQVELDGFGPFVRVVSDGSRSVEVKTRAKGLPVDSGVKHVVTVLLYQGDGLYTEAPPGQLIAGNLNGIPITLSRAFY